MTVSVPSPASIVEKGKSALQNYFTHHQDLTATGKDGLYDLRRYVATQAKVVGDGGTVRTIPDILRQVAQGGEISFTEMKAFNNAADVARIKLGNPSFVKAGTSVNAFASEEYALTEIQLARYKSEQAIVKTELAAMRAVGVSASESAVSTNIHTLLKNIGRMSGGVPALAASLTVGAVGPLRDLLVKDPTQAESLAKMLIEYAETGTKKDLNNNVEQYLDLSRSR